jgi:hypothetical protein
MYDRRSEERDARGDDARPSGRKEKRREHCHDDDVVVVVAADAKEETRTML